MPLSQTSPAWSFWESPLVRNHGGAMIGGEGASHITVPVPSLLLQHSRSVVIHALQQKKYTMQGGDRDAWP